MDIISEVRYIMHYITQALEFSINVSDKIERIKWLATHYMSVIKSFYCELSLLLVD